MDATEGLSGGYPGDDIDILRALAIRLTIHPFPGQQSPADVQLFVGKLPPALPFSLPVPEGSRLLGGIVSPRQETTVILQTDLSPDAAVAFYRERLIAEGWTEPERGGSRESGFVASMTEMRHRATFCRSDREPPLIVFAFDEAGGRSGLRLTIPSEQSPFGHGCRRQRRGGSPDFMQSILPPLVGPLNTSQQPHGGGGSPDRVHSDAELIGDLDLAALPGHYYPQIEQAGWTQQEAGENGPVIWSTWTFEIDGEPWRGNFYVLQRPDLPRHFMLHIQAEWAVNDEEQA